MNKKKQYIITIIAGLLLISLGIFYHLIDLANEIIGFLLINAGTVMVVIGVIQFNKLGAGSRQDERTRKIGARAVAYSWLITFVTLNIIFWIDCLNLIRVTLSQGLGIILYTMVLSAGIFKYILQRRGIAPE